MTRRGKYTFEMRLALPIKLLLDSEKALGQEGTMETCNLIHQEAIDSPDLNQAK